MLRIRFDYMCGKRGCVLVMASETNIVRIVIDASREDSSRTSSSSTSSSRDDSNVDHMVNDPILLGGDDLILRCCHVGNADENSIGCVHMCGHLLLGCSLRSNRHSFRDTIPCDCFCCGIWCWCARLHRFCCLCLCDPHSGMDG